MQQLAAERFSDIEREIDALPREFQGHVRAPLVTQIQYLPPDRRDEKFNESMSTANLPLLHQAGMLGMLATQLPYLPAEDTAIASLETAIVQLQKGSRDEVLDELAKQLSKATRQLAQMIRIMRADPKKTFEFIMNVRSSFPTSKHNAAVLTSLSEFMIAVKPLMTREWNDRAVADYRQAIDGLLPEHRGVVLAEWAKKIETLSRDEALKTLDYILEASENLKGEANVLAALAHITTYSHPENPRLRKFDAILHRSDGLQPEHKGPVMVRLATHLTVPPSYWQPKDLVSRAIDRLIKIIEKSHSLPPEQKIDVLSELAPLIRRLPTERILMAVGVLAQLCHNLPPELQSAGFRKLATNLVERAEMLWIELMGPKQKSMMLDVILEASHSLPPQHADDVKVSATAALERLCRQLGMEIVESVKPIWRQSLLDPKIKALDAYMKEASGRLPPQHAATMIAMAVPELVTLCRNMRPKHQNAVFGKLAIELVGSAKAVWTQPLRSDQKSAALNNILKASRSLPQQHAATVHAKISA